MPEQEPRPTSVTRIESEEGAEWVREMHSHYSMTGSYRVEDVQRVLGDPRTVVNLPTDKALFAAALLGIK